MPAKQRDAHRQPAEEGEERVPDLDLHLRIVPHGAPQKDEISKFVNYALTIGKKYEPALDFAPVPKVVLKAAKKTLAHL